ncbi:MAG TPA: FkbM family methyltransferase [Xanthobacteraceae bacterium]
MLNFAIVGARALAGRSSRVIARRRDVNWELELNEGIDLAIYLGLYQRIPRRAARWITPGALVLDIGANIGAHSLPLARAVGRDGVVVAVEPTDYAFCRLQANAALNPDLQSRLILVQAALTAQTDGPGPKENARFYSRWPLSGGGPDRTANTSVSWRRQREHASSLLIPCCRRCKPSTASIEPSPSSNSMWTVTNSTSCAARHNC